MESLRDSEVSSAINQLREAEQQQAVIRSKKKEALAELKRLGAKPENLKKEIATLRKSIEEQNEVIARRIRKANSVLKSINTDGTGA
jgi:peptidoglycan hydrolase CwlO-like protein